MPLWMGTIAVLGFAGILALFIACTAALASILFASRFRLVALPFIWLIFEWMKSWVLTGFPWLDIGYTQTSSWFFSWAPIGGVYLISLMVVLVSSLLAMSLNFLLSRQKIALVPIIGILTIVLLSFSMTGLLGLKQMDCL